MRRTGGSQTGMAKHAHDWREIGPTKLYGSAEATPQTIAVQQENEMSAEEAAKRAWLARLDAPVWRQAAAAVAAAAVVAPNEAAIDDLIIDCDRGVDAACEELPGRLSEEEAKKRWLARLDAPTWGAVAAAVSCACLFCLRRVGTHALTHVACVDCRQGVCVTVMFECVTVSRIVFVSCESSI